MPTKARIIIALLLLLPAALVAQERSVKIVASIKPLTLLIRAIAPDDILITTLVPAGASPHTYQMRPSDRRALAEADTIFWIGPELELFLQRTLTNREFSSRAHALMPVGATAENDKAQHDEHGHQHMIDPHVWLNPKLALVIATDIRDQLREYPGVDKKALDARLEHFRDTLQQKEMAIRKALAPMKSVSIFTSHDALRRFAAYYDLTITDELTPAPATSPGARHLNEIQQRLRRAKAPCLLTEPQFNRDWWQNLTDNVDVQLSAYDPMATDVPETPDGYLRFQQSLADAVLACKRA